MAMQVGMRVAPRRWRRDAQDFECVLLALLEQESPPGPPLHSEAKRGFRGEPSPSPTNGCPSSRVPPFPFGLGLVRRYGSTAPQANDRAATA